MTFQRFHETWFQQLQQLVHQLRQVPAPPETAEHHHQLDQLVQRVVNHYTKYNRFKSLLARRDVLGFYSEPCASGLEQSIQWIGGWRPTTVFHVIYTESSISFETHVTEILRGVPIGDLGDLSTCQFRRVSELQMLTVQEENDITDELYEWQDEASDLVEAMCGDIDEKLDKLSEILESADELRLKTIESLVDVLTPQQAAEFLVAAAELQSGIHAWGVQQDQQRQPTNLN